MIVEAFKKLKHVVETNLDAGSISDNPD